MDYAVAQDTTGSELHDFTVVRNPKCVKSAPESVTPRKNSKSSVDPVTPHTKKKKKESNRKRNWRASSAISTAIKDNLTSYNIKDQGKVVLNAMKLSGKFDLVKKEFQNPNKKTCGIRRTAGDTIKRIWTFWNENSTVSNNQTSRPSKTAADLFDNDPLLCEIVLEHWNVEEVTTKRNKRMYTQQYHTQNGINDKLFQKFKSENQDVHIGFTSFKSIKPFYVRPCKSGDIDTCQCRVHVNFHNAVDALLKMLRTSGMHFYFGSNEKTDGAECY